MEIAIPAQLSRGAIVAKMGYEGNHKINHNRKHKNSITLSLPYLYYTKVVMHLQTVGIETWSNGSRMDPVNASFIAHSNTGEGRQDNQIPTKGPINLTVDQNKLLT